jgi:hypothetical protein
MRLTSLFELKLRATEPELDQLVGGRYRAEDLDDDPDFRKVLLLLNQIENVKTICSCQGHFDQHSVPYMKPYITFSAGSDRGVIDLIRKGGFKIHVSGDDAFDVSFTHHIIGHWKDLYEALRTLTLATATERLRKSYGL